MAIFCLTTLYTTFAAYVTSSFSAGMMATADSFNSVGICPSAGLDTKTTQNAFCDFLCLGFDCTPIALYNVRRIAFCSSTTQLFGVVRSGAITDCYAKYFELFTDTRWYWPITFVFAAAHRTLILILSIWIPFKFLRLVINRAIDIIRSATNMTLIGLVIAMLFALITAFAAPFLLTL